jgi:hypothetical protein
MATWARHIAYKGFIGALSGLDKDS